VSCGRLRYHIPPLFMYNSGSGRLLPSIYDSGTPFSVSVAVVQYTNQKKAAVAVAVQHGMKMAKPKRAIAAAWSYR
jgi:hypothetical protein